MSKIHLPSEWLETNLEIIGEVVTGKTPSKKNPEYFGGSIPFIKPGDVNDQGNITLTNEHITDLGAATVPTIPAGSIVVTCIGNLGRCAITSERSATNQQINSVLPSSKVDVKFIYYQLRTLKEWMLSESSATTVTIINKSKFSQAPIVLPPLAEQKVIADKLDTLLAQVENTKARLESIPEILRTFRQSVLSAAVSGKLTQEWRAKNQFGETKEERLEKIRKYKYQNWIKEQEEKFEAKGKWPKSDAWKKKYKEAEINPEFQARELPESWVCQPLDGLVYISARIGWKGLKASEYTKTGPLFLSVHSLNYGREVKLSEAFHISQERYDESPEIMLRNDDILLCKDGAGIGKIGIVKNLQEPASINSSLLLIRSGKFFIPEFLYFFLAGPAMQRLVQERMTGSAVPHLFQRDVKEFVLEVPPLTEQTEIVRRVEEVFAIADNIEQKANAALERVNNLTQSILAKAFLGELTADWRAANLSLISGKNSAEALLQKIKVEREALSSKKKPKKNTAARKKA